MHELFNYVCDELKDLEKKAKQNGLTNTAIRSLISARTSKK